MPEVFISYSRDSEQLARRLAAFLSRAGFATWADFDTQVQGQALLETIEQALGDARCFIIVIGPNSRPDEIQDWEWQAALKEYWENPDKIFIPVLHGRVNPPAFLKDWACLQITPSQDETAAFNTVAQALSLTPRKRRTVISAKPDKAWVARIRENEAAVKALRNQ